MGTLLQLSQVNLQVEGTPYSRFVDMFRMAKFIQVHGLQEALFLHQKAAFVKFLKTLLQDYSEEPPSLNVLGIQFCRLSCLEKSIEHLICLTLQFPAVFLFVPVLYSLVVIWFLYVLETVLYWYEAQVLSCLLQGQSKVIGMWLRCFTLNHWHLVGVIFPIPCPLLPRSQWRKAVHSTE